jgi:hypothetical protein
MTELGDLKIWGTPEGTDKSLKLDEISILAKAEVIRALGIFLINAAYEIDVNEVEHVHLQDSIMNFSYESHVDVIVLNQEKVKLVDEWYLRISIVIVDLRGAACASFACLSGGNGQSRAVICTWARHTLRSSSLAALRSIAKRFALARFGGVIVFWGNGEALPDVVNRDIDALAGAEEIARA